MKIKFRINAIYTHKNILHSYLENEEIKNYKIIIYNPIIYYIKILNVYIKKIFYEGKYVLRVFDRTIYYYTFASDHNYAESQCSLVFII